MKARLTYKPEGASKRIWTFDPENPSWDLAYVTETETGWPWQEFMEKLSQGSHLALRALIFAFRKRDEQRLSIGGVQVTLDEIEIDEEPDAEPPKVAEGEGEA